VIAIRRDLLKLFRVICSISVIVGTVAISIGSVELLAAAKPAFADGPAPCSAGSPPFAQAGFCGTYSGFNTWYGTYGPGFPTAQGFGLCADPPASGGDYPAPNYNYASGNAPAGAAGDWNALGFAFSEGQALGYWTGLPAQFTADQAAASAKILYDSVIWNTLIPAMDPGLTAAYNAFNQWYLQGRGMADSPPQLAVSLVGGGTSFTTSGTDHIHMEFPGTDAPLIGESVLLTITNGTFNTPTGPTSIGVTTDSGGNADVTIFVNGGGTGSMNVTVSSSANVGQPGLGFYHPTAGNLSAQYLAAFPAPTTLSETQYLQGSPQTFLPSGTVSVQKSGNDSAYYSVAGAVFQVLQGSNVVATLTTDSSGATPPSGQLHAAGYTVHESSAPPGYQLSPDQSVTIVALTNTVVDFTGPNEELIIPATLSIAKVDAEGSAPLSGAIFDIQYSSANNGVFDEDLGSCTTTISGQCSPTGNDGTSLLPGNYQITETQAPSGYYLNPNSTMQTLTLTPGEAGTVTFADFTLGSLNLSKTGNDPAYFSVAGAEFSVIGPSPAVTSVGTLIVTSTGTSNTLTGLLPGSYTVTETTPPPGYQAVSPISVTVATGHTATTVNVLDSIQAATLTLYKVDAQTQALLAGAVMEVKYSSANNGVYDQDLGTCSTSGTGQCSPSGNDGTSLLPGNYQITEVTAPAGYSLDPIFTTEILTLTPGQAASATFADHLLVSATFHKIATGNVNTAEVTYAGADVDIYQGAATGPQVATCTTDNSGSCTTSSALVSGSPYCWAEVTAPPGLSSGAGGCFTADNAQSAQPITVTDAGLFVPVSALKVDASSSSTTLPGATLDLYRVDKGVGPNPPQAPTSSPAEVGQSWMGQSVTGSDGIAPFGLQYPGYAYCVVEITAPANYQVNNQESCSGVLSGVAVVPPPIALITVTDSEAAVVLTAHKFNSLMPSTGIAGAVYDLYVQGGAPPSGVTGPIPADAAAETGDTWFERGTSDSQGMLSFTVPSGYGWCLKEVTAPLNYSLDSAMHCTGVVDQSTPQSAATIALPELPATLQLTANKFNSLQPSTVIADATYELLVLGPTPYGYFPPTVPPNAVVPSGDVYWNQGTTDAQGFLSFEVPAGSAWCLHELVAPIGYQTDASFHCSGVLTTDSATTAMTMALPELPVPTPTGTLAFTGGPSIWVVWGAALMILGGTGLLLISRRKRDLENQLIVAEEL
jgi:hypothetical protein